MKKIIHNLRQKPPHVLRMVAFVTSIFITSLVGIIWIANLISLNASQPVETAEVTNEPSPIALMYGQMKDFAKSFGNNLASVSTVFNKMKTATTSDDYTPKDTVATSTDGSIGVSTTDNSSANSLTE